MKFTSEQHYAITTTNTNLVVTAGAGSGKTRVLVERYLAMLENNPAWKLNDLVAITFTDKAAREMRDRVREALHDRIIQADAELQALWQGHLSALDSARIGTIHSLCAALLRANPAWVPVDPRFEVLDENQATMLSEDAVELALAELINARNPLLQSYDLRELRNVLSQFISRSAAADLIEAIPPYAEDLMAGWESARQAIAHGIIQQVQADTGFHDLLNWQPETGWPQDDKLMDCWRVVHETTPQLLSNDSDAVYTALMILKDKQKINLTGGKAASWGGQVGEVKAILGNIRTNAENYLKAFPAPITEQDHDMAALLIEWRGAVGKAAQIYNSLKDEYAALDYDDLETLTADLLRTYPDEVARRYVEREFKHVMVDEFQDTNARQRDILYHLCGVDSAETVGRLFVVGDPKQSIYAFRGADVSVFNAVRDHLVSRQGQETPLSESFRTHEKLVWAFNSLFESLLGKQPRYGHEVAFGVPMRAARPAQPHHDTPIELIGLEEASGAGRKLSARDARRWEALEIAAKIQDFVAQEKPVWDKATHTYRPFQWGDAAILFRRMTHVLVYEEAFKAQGIDYLTIAGKGYYDRQEVWDMLNLLRALHNPDDNLALASALRSPMFGLSDDALFALRLMREGNTPIPLWAALNQHEQIAYPLPDEDWAALGFARECLGRLRELAGRISAEEMIETALEETAYDAILTALPNGDRRRGNLEKLIVKARGYASLGEFLFYVKNLVEVEPREGEASLEGVGAVKLMTIHKSKGLEFPVVFLADVGKRAGRSRHQMLMYDSAFGAACCTADDESKKRFAYQQAKRWENLREEAEDKRLFYVAATRAQDYLILAGTLKTGEDAPTSGDWLAQTAHHFGLGAADHAVFPESGVRIRLHRPPQPDDLYQSTASQTESGWDVLARALIEQRPMMPPLLATLPTLQRDKAQHLSVSQLEKLGSIGLYTPEEIGRRDFRDSVLHDAPPPIAPAVRTRDMRKLLGRVVHRALQLGILPSTRTASELDDILSAYAWDEGVTEQRQMESLVREAIALLQLFETRGEPSRLLHAEHVLREVPFVYRLEGRIIHGVIDALYKSGDGWHVMDYKTANVSAQRVHQHAERYLIQVGAYAQAVQARTGQTPEVMLYYLHSGVKVRLTPNRWQPALARLSYLVDSALGDFADD